VSTEALEEFMTDAATDVDRSQETQISAEYLAQLRELAESQGGRSTVHCAGPSL
jgi:hypothetical protein